MNKENMDVLKDKINFARYAVLFEEKAITEVLNFVTDIGIDMSLITKIGNGVNIEDAILCFIQYGEYDLENILREIQAASEEEKK